MPGRPYSCGIDVGIDVVGGKWKALILWAVQDGPRRFGELRRMLPEVSEKVLIQQLRELEKDEIVHREAFGGMPPRVEYSLTGYGAALNAALAPLARWGAEHKARMQKIRDREAESAAGERLPSRAS